MIRTQWAGWSWFGQSLLAHYFVEQINFRNGSPTQIFKNKCGSYITHEASMLHKCFPSEREKCATCKRMTKDEKAKEIRK